MVVHGHGGASHSLEMVETVLEVADVAWKAMELRHRHQHQEKHKDDDRLEKEEEEIASLRMENRRLRKVLEENLKLLQRLAESPSLSDDCPSDLHTRLVEAVDSTTFLNQLESLHQASLNAPSNHFPFNKATGVDLSSAEIIVNVGLKEPSLWVWVTHENALPSVEELSGIDDEAYVIVHEELVVDGVANFIARCILSNPKSKNLTPEELQKTVAKALGGISKLESMFKIWHYGNILFALSTWGLTLAGLYRYPAIVKVAAKGIATTGIIAANGIATTGNFIMKAV